MTWQGCHGDGMKLMGGSDAGSRFHVHRGRSALDKVLRYLHCAIQSAGVPSSYPGQVRRVICTADSLL